MFASDDVYKLRSKPSSGSILNSSVSPSQAFRSDIFLFPKVSLVSALDEIQSQNLQNLAEDLTEGPQVAHAVEYRKRALVTFNARVPWRTDTDTLVLAQYFHVFPPFPPSQ